MQRGLGRRLALADRIGLLVTPPALLLSLFLVFLRFHGYSPLAPEALICLAILAGLGLLIGLPGAIAGPYAGILVLAALAALFYDIQWQRFAGWDASLAAVVAASLAVLWLLRRQLSRTLPIFACALLVASAILPSGRVQIDWSKPPAESAPPSQLPLVLHIVLDEQIGIEGIPREFDRDGRVARQLETFYLDRGFRVFGRAYARYSDTAESLSNLFNFSRSSTPYENFGGSFSEGAPLPRNAYFQEMSRRGYRLHVYQSGYMGFCEGGDGVEIAACFEYDLETIRALEGTSLGVPEKARAIAAVFVRLSFLLSEAKRAYTHVRELVAERGVQLPAWDTTVGRLSAVSAMSTLARVEADVIEAEPGAMFFVHLMLPHFPYAYQADCTLRARTDQWLNSGNAMADRKNTPAMRRTRYPFYLDQVTCTHRRLGALFSAMDDAGIFEDAVVLVHGDHGSRIVQWPLRVSTRERLSARDYVDGFSTLFAIKRPGELATYDRRMLALDELFERHVRTDGPSRSAGPEPRPEIELGRFGIRGASAAEIGDKKMIALPMPRFSRGGVER